MWQIVKSLEDSTSKQEKESDERLKVMLEVKFQREQAQANRDHELVMAHLLLHAGINQLIKRKTKLTFWRCVFFELFSYVIDKTMQEKCKILSGKVIYWPEHHSNCWNHHSTIADSSLCLGF